MLQPLQSITVHEPHADAVLPCHAQSQEYVVNLSVWHERIVRLAEEAEQQKDAKVARAASGDITSTVQSDWTRLQLW